MGSKTASKRRVKTNKEANPAEPEAHVASDHPDVETLRSGRFIIKTYQYKLNPGSKNDNDDSGGNVAKEPLLVETGCILSQTLDKAVLERSNKDATMMTMALLRKITPGMSAFSPIHRFCTSSGTVIRDESISIAEYLSIEKPPKHDGTDSRVPKETSTELDKTKSSEKDGSSNETKAEKAPQRTKVINIYFKSPKHLNASVGVGVATGTGAGTDTSANAPEGGAPGGGAPGGSAPEGGVPGGGVPVASIPGGDVPEGGAQPAAAKAELRRADIVSLIPADEGPTASDDLKLADSLSEQEWGTVLRNCAVFYGWVINPRTSRVERASRPAFQLRSKVSQDPVSKIPDFVPAPKVPTDDSSTDSSSVSDEPTPSSEEAAPVPPPAQPSDEPAADEDAPELISQDDAVQFELKPGRGIPNFRINDDSKIEITACKHELMLAMARNDFSSESTEATASGGFGGFSASVSASHAQSSETSKSTSSTSVQQILVARYLFPRCDLLLYPEDLEPTPELASLLDTVQRTKSIQAIRQIHRLYGTHFCQNLTLGARLLTTKLLKYDKNTSEDEAKQSLRWSVGVAVSTPYGGGGVKHSQEKGSSESHAREETTQQESQVFEACGGDTILANNPNAWATTVGRPELWRVINRGGLSPMTDLLSEIPGYTAVRAWFIQAAPALTKYITLDENLSSVVRLRLTSPSNSLSVFNDGKAGFYLGHGVGSQVTPRLNGVSTTSVDSFWVRSDYVIDKFLFQPETYRAPVIQGFPNFDVGGGRFGQKYNDAFAQTVWRMSCPFSDELVNGSRIVMQTCPFVDPAAEADTFVANPVSHMTVFRNAQGVFLPAMSDSDEFQYWRIQKVGSEVPGEHIQTNDEVRLCWAFRDQTTGFRDFKDDCFGRRRNQCPPELKDTVLYLKMPWPRFERSNKPNAMIMSTESTQDLRSVSIETTQSSRPLLYFLQDVKFRIDGVANEIYGDADDYLLKDVRQQGDLENLTRSEVRYLQPVYRNVFGRKVIVGKKLRITVRTFGLPAA